MKALEKAGRYLVKLGLWLTLLVPVPIALLAFCVLGGGG